MHRQIAGKLTGPVTKWFVLAFWIIAVVVLGSFAGKLTDVQNNEASSWLPGNAESTRALEKMEPFQDPNAIPTTVVYEKDLRLHAARTSPTLKEQAAELQADGRRRGQGHRPDPLRGRPGRPDDGDLQPRRRRAGTRCPASPRTSTTSPRSTARRSTSPAPAARPSTPPSRSRASTAPCCSPPSAWSSCCCCSPTAARCCGSCRSSRVIVALASSLGLIYFLAKYADLTVNGQSQAIVSILVIGAGTDYALLLVARYREELRRHEDRHEAMAFALHRATPAIIASASTVIVGMLCLTAGRDELHRRPRPGVRHRHRRRPARDDHAAAGPAGDLRPLDVLAQAPDLRLATSRPPRASGPGSAPGSRPVPAGSGSSPRWLLGVACARRPHPEHQRPVDRGLLHQGVRLGDRPEGARRARPGRQLDPGDGGRQRRPGGRGRRGDGRHRQPRAAERARSSRTASPSSPPT